MARTQSKIATLLIILLAAILVVASSYCFADIVEAESLTVIEDTSSINIDSILDCFSDEYLNENANEEVVVIAKFKDSLSHDISNDLDVDIDVRYSYTNIFNGESISIKIKDIYKLAELSYIESVELAEQYYTLAIDESSYSYSPSSNTNAGVFKNDTVYQGEGIVVAVIDAGFDTAHVAFSNTYSVVDTLDVGDIKTVLHELNSYELSGASAQSLYLSTKIAYAYDYGEGDLDLYTSSTSHGTHVAGIIAGNDDSSFTGVAKHAQLALMKVGDSQGYMYNDTIAAALEDCLKLNVDVVNMSLGSASGFATVEDNVIYEACVKLEEAGISVVCAAGNSFTSAYGSESKTNASTDDVDNASVNSPACYNETTSIANAQETHWFSLGTTKITYSDSYNTLTTTYGDFSKDVLGSSSSLNIDYVVLKDGDDIAKGQDSDYIGVDVTDKIVVCSRGDITFTQKVQIAASHGAKAVIVVNNSSTMGTPSITESTIPLCLVSQDLGDILDGASSKTLSFSEDNIAFTIADSSSKGVTNDLTLGVDVAGFGTSVFSSINDQSYGQMTGTSMASPNVAGVVAIVRQRVQFESTEFNITNKVDVMNTAMKLIMSNTTLLYDLNNVLISPRSQGAGLANIPGAILSYAYISTASSDSKTKLELGDNLTKDITLNFTINNCTNHENTYEITIDLLTELIDNGYMSGNDKNLTFTITSINGGSSNLVPVDDNSSKTVEVKLSLSESSIEYINQYANGIYLEGYISAQSSDGTITCPFIGFYGDWDEVDMLDVTSYDDENDVYMRASTSLGIYADSYYLPLGEFVYNLSDDYEGEEPAANEEFASLSIFSQSMYALGYIQLGLLRSAEYIEINVVDLITNEILYTESESYVGKTVYYPSYDLLYGGDIFTTISPYSLDLYNNGQYEVQVNVYRKYDEDSDDNTISATYTQKFYVDEEVPTIDDVKAETQGNKYIANFTMTDNHYIQALAICTGSGSSTSSVTLSVEDIYPVSFEATGTGKTVNLSIDVTDAVKNASNGYLYFYIVDYAQNSNIYYLSTSNWTGTAQSFNKKSSSSQTTSSSTPKTESSTIQKTFAFIETEITVLKNKEVNLASNQYLTSYSIDKKYTWTSSDKSIVAISSGKITGLQEGIAVVTVTDEDDNEAKLIVKVAPSPYSTQTYKATLIDSYIMHDTVTDSGDAFFGINLDTSSIKLAPSESFELTFKYSPYNYNYISDPITIEITSSDSCLTITGNKITATSAGTASLTITANGALVKTFEVEVVNEMYEKDGVLLACFSQNTSITVPATVTAIGSNAFSYAKNAQTVDLNNATIIYKDAFKNNTSIANIDLSNIVSIGNNAFEGCTSLYLLDLSVVTYIGDYAFKDCVNLQGIVFASSIDTLSISASAFEGCTKLQAFSIGTTTKSIVVDGELVYTLDYEEAILDTTITKIGKGAFSSINAVTLDLTGMTSLQRIEANAFEGNTKLKKIILPSSLEYIGKEAFKGCTALNSVQMGKKADQELTIGDNAFENSNVSVIDFSGIKTTFGDYTFLKCQNLSYINLGSVQDMGKYTFAAATNLISAVFEDGTKYVGEYAFAPITISSKTYYHTALKSVVIPQSVTKIEKYAFAYCSSLTSKNMDLTKVTDIEDYAFINCTSLYELDLASIVNIGYAAFAQSSIQAVNLNSEMQNNTLTIGEVAFYECEYLQYAIFPTDATANVVIEKGAFYNCEKFETELFINMMHRTTITLINYSRIISVGDYAFTKCKSIKRMQLDSCTSIGYAAFADCENLEGLALPNVESIGRIAFYGTALKLFTLSNTVKSIGQGAFTDSDITVVLDESMDYSSSNVKLDNGVVYMKLDDGSYMLVYYPKALENSTYTILDGTSIIGEYAFIDNKSLNIVTLPSSIKYISNGAFFGCENLVGVVLKSNTFPTLLTQYSTVKSSQFPTFVDYDEDDYKLILFVASEEFLDNVYDNKTWSTIFDWAVTGDETSTFAKFMALYQQLQGESINSSNKDQFELLKKYYNSLGDYEKGIVDEDTEISKNYQKMTSTYDNYTSETDTSIANNPNLVLVLVIIGASMVFVLAVSVALAIFLTKRHMDLKRIKETSSDNVELTDVFGGDSHDEYIPRNYITPGHEYTANQMLDEEKESKQKAEVLESNEGNDDDKDSK